MRDNGINLCRFLSAAALQLEKTGKDERTSNPFYLCFISLVELSGNVKTGLRMRETPHCPIIVVGTWVYLSWLSQCRTLCFKPVFLQFCYERFSHGDVLVHPVHMGLIIVVTSEDKPVICCDTPFVPKCPAGANLTATMITICQEEE